MTEELEKKAENFAGNFPIPLSLYEIIEPKKELMREVIKQVYIAVATEAEATWEQERDLMWKRIDRYKEDLKKLRVAFIQLQVEALSKTNLSDFMGRLAEELKEEG